MGFDDELKVGVLFFLDAVRRIIITRDK
jgi:hypothetical protein